MDRRSWFLASVGSWFGTFFAIADMPFRRVNLLKVGVVNSNERLYMPEAVRQLIKLANVRPLWIRQVGRGVSMEGLMRSPIVGQASDFRLESSDIVTCNLQLRPGIDGDIRANFMGIGHGTPTVFTSMKCARCAIWHAGPWAPALRGQA